MKLTHENYFSAEAQLEYMGSSQFKAFRKCEAGALAELRGDFFVEPSTALIVGSYVDAHFDGTLDIFKAQHPEIFKRDGSLKAEYEKANEIIERIERDEMMMKYLSGDKQVIMTGEIAGVPFKIMVDSFHEGKAIVDRKIMRDFAPIWDPDVSKKVPFVEFWGYDIQGTIYQEVVRQNDPKGRKLPFFIAGATKEPTTDIALLAIPQDRLDAALLIVKEFAPAFDAVKRGTIEPVRCERCDYCKETKVLTKIIDYREI